MKFLGIVFLSGFFLVFNGVANAASLTIDDVYQMLLEQKEVQNKQQEKIASLEANQRSLERDATNSKLQEARLRDDLHKAKIQLASVQKATSHDFGEPTFDTPQRDEGFVASAGLLYVNPTIENAGHFEGSGKLSGDIGGFDLSVAYSGDNNFNYTVNYTHFSSENTFWDDVTDATDSSFDVNYDSIDFEIGKVHSLTETASIEVSGGVRYLAIDDEARTTPSLLTNKLRYETDYWGIGPQISLSPQWHPFEDGVSLFSNISGSILVGLYDESNRTVVSSVATTNEVTFASVASASLGIGYELNLDSLALDFKTGYRFESFDKTSPIDDGSSYTGYHGAFGKIKMAY